jgi:hypothetical protein
LFAVLAEGDLIQVFAHVLAEYDLIMVFAE